MKPCQTITAELHTHPYQSAMGVSLLVLAVPLLWWVLKSAHPLALNANGFIFFHTAVEIFAVVVAMLIFVTGYRAILSIRKNAVVLLGILFFGVGLLDFLHLMTDEGVPDGKRPFAGPEAVLAYLSRYTHRVAIANSRLLAMDERGVTFKWKDYRDKSNPDRPRHKTMTLAADEFMRRFLLHVLPGGFHRIRHFGLIANNGRKEKLALARQLLNVVPAATIEVTVADTTPDEPTRPNFVCAHCGAQMIVIESFLRGQAIRAPPAQRGSP